MSFSAFIWDGLAPNWCLKHISVSFLTDAGVVIAEENKGYAPILLHADLCAGSRAQSQLSKQ